MEEASKRFLSTADRLETLLLRFNNDLTELLLQALKENHLLSECLSHEFKSAWKKKWLEESKCARFVPLIPSTCKPPFFGAAISFLNNQGKKDAVIEYLEIFAGAPYYNFYAQKVLTKLLIKSIEMQKENAASQNQLFLKAEVHAENAAKYHHSHGHFLLATLHYRMALRRTDLALQHHEVAYKNILIAEKLAEHSDQSIQVDPSELNLIDEMCQFLKKTVFTAERIFEKVRAESAATKEANYIIDSSYSCEDPTDNPRLFTL